MEWQSQRPKGMLTTRKMRQSENKEFTIRSLVTRKGSSVIFVRNIFHSLALRLKPAPGNHSGTYFTGFGMLYERDGYEIHFTYKRRFDRLKMRQELRRWPWCPLLRRRS